MKVSTLTNRIAKSNNKNGSTPNNNNYDKAIQLLTSNGNKVYIGYYTGAGKFSKANTANPEIYLNAWGIDFEIGNDAPRGGVSGSYITLTVKGKRQCKEYYNQYLTGLKLSIENNLKFEEKQKALKEAEELEISNYAALIDKIEGEEMNTTAGRLKIALNDVVLEKQLFWKIVKTIRKK